MVSVSAQGATLGIAGKTTGRKPLQARLSATEPASAALAAPAPSATCSPARPADASPAPVAPPVPIVVLPAPASIGLADPEAVPPAPVCVPSVVMPAEPSPTKPLSPGPPLASAPSHAKSGMQRPQVRNGKSDPAFGGDGAPCRPGPRANDLNLHLPSTRDVALRSVP